MDAEYFSNLGEVVINDGGTWVTTFKADSLQAASKALHDNGFKRTAGWLTGTGGNMVATVERLEAPSGAYAIKVDGEEIDHADTRAQAEQARNTIIYGGIGTEANTTIERRKG
jgi:hypothetical protein